MSETIQVVIVDQHPLFREGVAGILRAQPDIEIVGQGGTSEDALDMACDLLPDLLLMDIDIHGGLDAIRQIAASCPVIRPVILTASSDAEDVAAALRAGARAYILKDVGAAELVSILRGVCGGDVYVTPTLVSGLLADLASQSPAEQGPAKALARLTERERQILEGVSTGLSNKEIGKQLHLSEKTVKHHMTNILQKLQARNRVEAALLAQAAVRLEPRA